MIELGEMVIRDEEHLCQSREIVLSMASDLTLGDAKATQLATVISEIGTRSLIERNSCQCQFGLQSTSTQTVLAVEVTCEGLEDLASSLPFHKIFDASTFVNKHDGNEDLSVLSAQVHLSQSQQTFDERFLSRQRKRFAKLQASEVHFELKNNPEAFIQRERLSGLGTFVAGMAHELNNPMMGILNYVQYCLKHTDQEDKRVKPLKSAEREALRCVGLVEDLLRYSRGSKESEGSTENVDVSALIQRVVNLLDFRIKNELELLMELPSTPLLVPMKVNSVEQVLVNLLTNAMDSLDQRPKKQIVIRVSSTKDSCIIEVEDSGCGIKAEQIKQIYTPFFTTKKPGQGTGLGMSICLRIIEEHQGKIEVTSELNQGTKVQVVLPLK
ncbi:MAG: HAMP domain-containing sensor histidine kinase [Pseudomonadales bacterium]